MGLRVDVEWRVPVGEVVRAVVGLRLRLGLGLTVRAKDAVNVFVRDEDGVTVPDVVWTAVAVILLLQLPVCAVVRVGGVVVVRLRVNVE